MYEFIAIGIIDNKSKILQLINKLKEAIFKSSLFSFINKLELKIFIGTTRSKKKIKKIKIICKSSIIFVQHSNRHQYYRLFESFLKYIYFLTQYSVVSPLILNRYSCEFRNKVLFDLNLNHLNSYLS